MLKDLIIEDLKLYDHTFIQGIRWIEFIELIEKVFCFCVNKLLN